MVLTKGTFLKNDNGAKFVNEIRLSRPASKAMLRNGEGSGDRKFLYVSSNYDCTGATVVHEYEKDDKYASAKMLDMRV